MSENPSEKPSEKTEEKKPEEKSEESPAVNYPPPTEAPSEVGQHVPVSQGLPPMRPVENDKSAK